MTSTLSKTDRALVERLKRMPNEEISLEDIPQVLKRTFTNQSGIGSLFRPIKQQVTLRLDRDVLAWAKSEGSGYQSRINAALRRAMTAEMRTTEQR